MTVSWFAGGLLLAVIGQAVLLPEMAPGLLRPDCFLLLVCLLSVRVGAEVATLQGFAIGLCQDALSGGPLGLRAFVYCLLGFAIARLSRDLYTEEPLAQFWFLLGGTLLVGLLTLGLLAFFLESPPLLPTLAWVVLPEALATALLGLTVLWLLRRAQPASRSR